jgi:hypothetical protein
MPYHAETVFESKQQKIIAGLVSTAILCLLGSVLWFMFAASATKDQREEMQAFWAVTMPSAVFGLGVLLFIIAIAFGWRQVAVRDEKQPVMTATNAYVVAMWAQMRDRTKVEDWTQFDASELTFYVQMAFPNGDRHEFRTDAHVYEQMGEGLLGTVRYQGHWLCSFERTLRPSPQVTPYQPGS